MAAKKSDPLEDKMAANRIRRSIASFNVDTSGMSLSFRNGTVHLSGLLKPMGRENAGQDLRKVLEQMIEAIKASNTTVREVNTAYLRLMY